MTFKTFMELMGGISGFYYSLLTVSLIASYYYLRKTLHKRFESHELTELSKVINTLFLVLVISFSLRTILLFGEGHYENLV